jgi:galactokinase
MKDASSAFKSRFGVSPAHVVHAPGCVEILGSLAEFNQGLALSAAVDRCVEAAVAPRQDGKIELFSTAFSKSEIFWLDRIEKNPEDSWADPAKAVLNQLRKKRVHFSGFSAVIHDGISAASGIDPSAPLEVATALAVRQLFPFSLAENGVAPRRDSRGKLPALSSGEKLQIAKICHAAHTEFLDRDSGLLHAMTSLFGKAGHVMETDFQSLGVKHELFPGVAVVVCGFGGEPEQPHDSTIELRRNCESAARSMGVAALRFADLKKLEACRAKLGKREYECARHVIEENLCVVAAVRLLREYDLVQFGQYMFQSHENSCDLFKNSEPELAALVEIARAIPGCLGARLIDGGGATVNLVAHHQAESFIHTLSAEYLNRTRLKTEPILCQISDGAG